MGFTTKTKVKITHIFENHLVNIAVQFSSTISISFLEKKHIKDFQWPLRSWTKCDGAMFSCTTLSTSCSLARLCKCQAPYLPKNRGWKLGSWKLRQIPTLAPTSTNLQLWLNSYEFHRHPFFYVPPTAIFWVGIAPAETFSWSYLQNFSRGEWAPLARLWNAKLQSIACAQTIGKARGTTGDLTQTIPTPKLLATKKWMQNEIIHNKWM